MSAPPSTDGAPRYTIAARELCEFTAKHGDLERRFTPAPTAQEGIAGHATVRARRGSSYRAEVALAAEHAGLRVRGRADGFDAAAGRLEEIKTHRGDLDRLPGNQRALHLAQARVYAWMLCREHGLAAIEVALVYFDVGSGRETVCVERADAAALQRHFEAHCERFMQWADAQIAHRAARDAALEALRFPHAGWRGGQRALAEAVWRLGVRGGCLLAQAPTGVGKTIATLFPMLKAMPGRLDRVVFLTAKGTGRAVALDALARLRRGMPPGALRVLELVARDKACEHAEARCDGASCPLAHGFYDRLPRARDAALAHDGALDRAALQAIGLAHGVCPYWLGQELARWCDALVADVNHQFDFGALLHGLAQASDWRVGLLVDEAHNLVERARSMLGAGLDPARLRALRRAGLPEPLRKPFDRLQRRLGALARDAAAQGGAPALPPASLADPLRAAADAVSALLVQTPDAVGPALAEFHFDLLRFLRVHEIADANWLFETDARRDAPLRLRNVVPAPWLKTRFEAVHASVLFSATLAPAPYYRDLLGLPASTPWLDVEPPFAPGQLEVRIAAHLRTRLAERAASLDAVADLIAAQQRERPGNHLAFFSSFDYLAQVADRFAARHPQVAAWRQAPSMDDVAREAFLARFVDGGAGVGFAVLGGCFAEGVDLVGGRLVGAVVVTLGLPPFDASNERMRRCLDERFGRGHDYAYLVPGLRKVAQAGGRVIRGPDERGVLTLVDDRFARPAVQRLLPAWWRAAPLHER